MIAARGRPVEHPPPELPGAAGVAGWAMVMVNDFVALAYESRACTVNVNVSAVIGRPVIVPVLEFSVRPSGRVPDDTDHVTVLVLFDVREAV